jgi:hypothetical protein
VTTSRSSASSWASLAVAIVASLALTDFSSAGPHGALTLGGGWAAAKPAAGTVDFVAIRILRKGNSVHFYGEWPAICSSGRHVTTRVDRIVALRPNGSFAGSDTFRKDKLLETFRFAGSIDSPTAADGTAESQLRAGSETCATGGIAWGARAAPRVTGRPKPFPVLYFGTTTRDDPVVLRVAAGSRRIQAGIVFTVACADGRSRSGSVVFPDVAIRGDGTFSATQRYATRFTATLTGRFGASSVGGTLGVRVRAPGGAVCTGTVGFAASP